MAENKRYMLAKLALEQGDRFQARDHLSNLLKDDQDNIEYWLLMSTVVDSNKERVFCLKKALNLDPGNKDARLGMILFGAHDPGDLRGAPIRKVDWARDLPDLRVKAKPKEKPKKKQYNYKRMVPLVTGSGIILILLFFSGILFPNVRSIFSPRLTITPITVTPSVDPGYSAALTGTPNPILQIPIGKVLDSPYTPTPAYVMTPHPGYGSYQTGLDAYRQGDFETMLTYMRSTANQLETPDIVYLVGEALRNLGRFNEALAEYERVLFLDPAFAPAYYSRALISPILVPGSDIKGDLDQALLLDPGFGQAYIERAKYYLDRGSYQLAYEDASQAIDFLPESHLAHLYRAWALLELNDFTGAQNSIVTALQLDINHIPSYLIAGRISLGSGDPGQALDLLTRYEPYDPNKTWVFYYSLGKAYYLSGNDLTESEQLLSRAVSMGGKSKDLYQTRALVNSDLGNLNQAVNDALQARNLDRYDFEINQLLGEFHYQKDQFFPALVYLNDAANLVRDEYDLARVHYWRALTFENLGKYDESISEWRNLISLPLIYVPDEWEYIAAEKLLPTATPTPTSTFTPTNTPTITPTETITPTFTLSPTPTLTPSPAP
jgi:tetratricopeptide (TPR) repeat protein